MKKCALLTYKFIKSKINIYKQILLAALLSESEKERKRGKEKKGIEGWGKEARAKAQARKRGRHWEGGREVGGQGWRMENFQSLFLIAVAPFLMHNQTSQYTRGRAGISTDQSSCCRSLACMPGTPKLLR